MESNYLSDIQKSPFLFLQDHPWDYFKPISNVINTSKTENICDDDTFYRTFMSESNMLYINQAIKKTVYNNSCDKFIVRNQKHEHLEQIMKGLYHDYAQHLPFNQKLQFNVLNKLVIDYCVNTILSEIDTRLKYQKDKFSPPDLLPTPINTSVKGSNSYLPIISSPSVGTAYFGSPYSDTPTTPSFTPSPTPYYAPSSAPAPGPSDYYAPSPTPSYSITPDYANNPGSQAEFDIFTQKVIETNKVPSGQIMNFQPYYFTDDRTNMFAKQKMLTINKSSPMQCYKADQIDNSYPHHSHAKYVSTQAPAQQHYYVPQTDSSRIKRY